MAPAPVRERLPLSEGAEDATAAAGPEDVSDHVVPVETGRYSPLFQQIYCNEYISNL